jgi:hypothetical protein
MTAGLIEMPVASATASPSAVEEVHSDTPDASTIDPKLLFLVTNVYGRVVELFKLPSGWDGCAAPPIDEQRALISIVVLAKIANLKMSVPSVVPTVDGSIQFEWHTQHHHIELVTEAVDHFSLFIQNRDNGHSETYETFQQARRALQNLPA